jgi:hypothetical protein
MSEGVNLPDEEGIDEEMGSQLPPECAAVDGDLAGLALGALSGKERMAALAHIDTCARCSAEVEALSITADQLLHLAPEVEPPVGFEARAFVRMGLRPAPARWRAWVVWRPKLVATLAGAALVIAFGLGALAGYGSRGNGPSKNLSPASSPIQTVSLLSGSRPVGRVMVYSGNPTWLFMYMDDSHWQGALRCEVLIDRGPTLALGQFWLSEGKGAWAASVNEPSGRLSEARVVDARGDVLAVAYLSSQRTS